MKVLSIISNAVSDAVEYVVEKNTIQAQQNRLKMVMRNEANLTERSYIALGKYYYENMRGIDDNGQNEEYCVAIDNSKVRMKKAVDRYKSLIIQKQQASCCEDFEDVCDIDEIAEDITLCCAYTDEEDADNITEDADISIASSVEEVEVTENTEDTEEKTEKE